MTPPVILSGAEAFRDAARALVADGVRHLDLLSYALDARIYAHAELVDAIKALALSSPYAEIRLLINQPRSAVRHAPLLVELSRRAPSRISVRDLAPLDLEEQGDWLLVDRRHLLRRRAPVDLEAELLQDAAGACQSFVDSYQRLWDRALPSAEFRDLGSL